MAVKWTAEQQKVIDTRDRNLLVSAAAGSGKTAVLVERILAMVKDPVRPIDIDQLLVVTFTRAAAGEMKERIGRALQQSLEENPENEHLQRQQTLLHHAQISTIHGFCSYVIKNYFQMIDLDPVYRMADEGEIRLMKSDVIQKVMEERFAEKDPAFTRFVESYAAEIIELEGLKALVVDDDFNTCDSVTKILVRVGMRSEWTLSGKEAVLRARQSVEMGDAFHAYIIDWRLPDMNGIEVTRQIRSLGDDTPIIILTAYDWSDIEVEARAAGVTAFCSKPMFMSDIRETLMAAIGQKQAEAEDNILPAADSDFRDRRILLVEDNELNSEIAVALLSEYGFQVDTAEDGAEAVEKVKNSRPGDYDLVLMDVQMPVMNGYEATERIRSLDDPALAGITILAMTANAFDEDRKKALACGMDGFLSKPIVIEELISTLQNSLG